VRYTRTSSYTESQPKIKITENKPKVKKKREKMEDIGEKGKRGAVRGEEKRKRKGQGRGREERGTPLVGRDSHCKKVRSGIECLKKIC
jgi:hypothetical protein